MNLDHIKYLDNDAELASTLGNEAYIRPGSILNIDLEILLSFAESKGLRGQSYQNWRMSLNV